MPPKKSQQEAVQQSLGLRLDSFLNMDDSLIQLSQAIDWSSLGEEYDLLYDGSKLFRRVQYYRFDYLSR